MSLAHDREPTFLSAELGAVDLRAHAAAFDRDASSARAATGVEAVRGTLTTTLTLRHAGARIVEIGYEWLGRAPTGAPVILVAGGISAHRHLAASVDFPEDGWLGGLVGGQRSLNPDRYCLLGLDFVGSDGTVDAPIDPADQAAAIVAVLDHLGIDQLEAFVGYSYGALVGLHLGALYPERLRGLVVASGAHKPHPYASAWRALQRQAVALGQIQNAEAPGLSLARQFAMLSYRTPEEFGERFEAAPVLVNGRVRVAAEDYLDAQGARYTAHTPAIAFLRLSESIDLHRVDPTRVSVPTTVIAVDGDRLVPLTDLVGLVEGLGPSSHLRVLRSPYGHDAFLKETDKIDAILAQSLKRIAGAATSRTGTAAAIEVNDANTGGRA